MRFSAMCGAAALLVVLLASPEMAMRAQDPPTRPTTAPAQAPQAEDQPDRPTFRVEASYVRVDVYPTANGSPVADLIADDFELLEDGVPQRITQFERVVLSSTTSREERRDPTSAADGRAQAADPRRRVFVIFLDTWHSTHAGSVYARRPLVEMLERLIGPEDLFAVMTPDMDARQITFGRKTELVATALEKYGNWGRRDDIIRTDPEEQQLEMCFPEDAPPRRCLGPGGVEIEQPPNAHRGVAAQLIRRKREEQVMAALDDLVGYLGAVREERKAVIAISQGWQLLRPKPELTRRQECESPPLPGRLGTGPDGRITTDQTRARGGNTVASPMECSARAMRYAMLDIHEQFTALTERANRFNVSFYPMDTRGLAAFDSSIGDRDERIRNDPGEWPNRATPGRPDPQRNSALVRDQDVLTSRLDSLRALAETTDGIAIVNTNDLDGGARRIIDDLSTYYLLGYYSTNTRLDGKWRRIAARVKRPGVDVRARKGYRALRPEDMVTASAAARTEAAGGAGEAAAGAEADLLAATVGALAGVRDGVPWRSRAAWHFAEAGPTGRAGRVWITAEIDAAAARAEGLAGGTLTVSLAGPDGAMLGDADVTAEPGARVLSAAIATDAAPPKGELLVRLRFTASDASVPLTDTLRIALPPTPVAVATARILRAGPATRQRFTPTADPRFRRGERVRLELPLATAATEVTAALLDRTGTPMAAIPVPARLLPTDETGLVFAVADLNLAPLAAGDYVVRLTVTHGAVTTQSLTAIRVVP